jgi:acyl-CoA reductase-like NAD-dependent aldehyde dehydrogenase
VAAVFERQQAARDATLLATAEERRDRLSRLADLLRENIDVLCEAVDRDFGGRSARGNPAARDLPSASRPSRTARRHVRGWMRARSARTGFWFLPGRSRIVPQPLGVVGIVVPWNYPSISPSARWSRRSPRATARW